VARSNTQAREAALGDLNRFGTQWRDAYLGASPELRWLTERAANAGPTAIERELERQALEELGLGRALSEEEARAATQAARLGAAARGMGTGTSALAQEVLNRDAAARARQDARRGFAMQTDQLLRQGDQLDRQFALTVSGVMDPAARLLGERGTGLPGANAGAGFATQIPQYAGDLFAQNAALASQNYGAQLGFLGSTYATQMSGVNALNSLAHDRWSTLTNMDYSRQVAAANQAAANRASTMGLLGAGLGAVGTILGGPIGGAMGGLLGRLF
jgi:hypothetical protein